MVKSNLKMATKTGDHKRLNWSVLGLKNPYHPPGEVHYCFHCSKKTMQHYITSHWDERIDGTEMQICQCDECGKRSVQNLRGGLMPVKECESCGESYLDIVWEPDPLCLNCFLNYILEENPNVASDI